KLLGGDCDAAIECLVANSECATKCQCQVNFYDTNNADSGGNCEPLENLKVDTIELKTRSETYVVISWKAPQAVNAVEEYRVLVQETSSEESVGKQLEANVTGLIPGDLYTITVISVDSNSRPAVQTTSPAPVQQATMPAVPGPIDLANSDLTASDGSITIKWKQTGTVTSYTITISELVINSATVNAPSYVISNNAALRNGHRYTLTVKAHSNSLESAEYTEEFRTVITKPNPPILQSCTEIVSTSVDLMWQEPLYPNGDVQYYLIDTTGPAAPPQINTSTNVATYKVDPLLEATYYCFNVRTVNDGAEDIQVSVNSNQLCCTTKAASSSEPTSVTTNVLSSRNISVSWNYPDNPKGDIFGYRLRLRVNDICQVEIIFYCTDCPNAQYFSYKDCAEEKQRQTIILNKNEINTTISYVVEQLLPYTKYDVWIAAHNAANDGMRHESEVDTISEVPQKPLNVAASVVSSSEITVTWNQPIPRPGVTTYHVKAYEVVNGVEKFVKISNVSGYSIQTVVFSQLEAYWNYTFTVVATTDKGDSEQSDMSPINRTNQAAPGKVLNFDVVKPNNDEHRKLKVIWSIPELRNRNGLIEEYTVEHNTTGTTVSSTVDATMDNLEILFNITPEEYYDIKVYAVNTENTIGAEVGEVYYAKPGPPNVPTIPALVEETSSPPSTQTTIEVKFSLGWFLNTDNGIRTDGGIVICPKSSCDNYGDTSQMKEPSHFATLETWKKSKAKGFTQAYRVTNRTWISDHVNSAGRRKRSSQVVELTIGEDSGCDKLEDDVYCNGPLPADIRIMVIAFVCTSGGCTESQQFGPYKTQPEPEALPIAIIAGVVSAVVVFLIIIIIIVVIKKRPRKNQPTKLEENEIDNFTNLNPHGLETPSVERKNIRKKRPIKLKDFEERVAELHKDSNLKFAHEYEELKTLTDPKTLKNVSNSLAETEENKLKNRYVNILPYDHTIVKLLPLEDDDEQASTFINANYIPKIDMDSSIVTQCDVHAARLP
ncbi:cytokine receptor domeless, partial [Mytilus galloprovincialis]